MFTIEDVVAAGWSLSINGRVGHASKDGETREIEVVSETPRFALLVNIAEREGRGFVVGYGGDADATAELIEACTGETYQPQTEAPLSEREPTTAEFVARLAESVAALDPSHPITAGDLMLVIDAARQPEAGV